MVKRINPIVYKKRLLKLADVVGNYPPERFDFKTFVGNDWKGKANLSCGTTACAFGIATTIPSFRRLGLRMSKYIGGYISFPHLLDDEPSMEASIRAAEVIFGLDEHEFKCLFIPFEDLGPDEKDYQFDNFEETSLDRDTTASAVAEHIRSFVKFKYSQNNAEE